MGDAERAQDLEIWQRQQAIDTARAKPAALPGPPRCAKCGKPNDRRREGFAVCFSCMDEARR